jgi:hypothetical protein
MEYQKNTPPMARMTAAMNPVSVSLLSAAPLGLAWRQWIND